MSTRSFVAAGVFLLAGLGCQDDVNLPTSPANPSPDADVAAAVVPVSMIVSGDMHAACNNFNKAKATAPLVESRPSALVFALGDDAGQHGTPAEFQCYDLTWGKFKSRTYAVLGNHERNIDPTADAYYDYFNGEGVDSGAAGHRARGYYALTYGGWRIFVANSESLSLQTEQAAWITRDLAANPARCIMAIWHKPMFTSSAGVKPYPKVLPMWKALYNAGADVIIGGHSHQYERFAPTTPVGIVNNTRGIRHWVVGAGGGFLMKFSATPHPASLKRLSTFGVMKLDLWPDHYTWQFIGTAGQILDSGTAYCH